MVGDGAPPRFVTSHAHAGPTFQFGLDERFVVQVEADAALSADAVAQPAAKQVRFQRQRQVRPVERFGHPYRPIVAPAGVQPLPEGPCVHGPLALPPPHAVRRDHPGTFENDGLEHLAPVVPMPVVFQAMPVDDA